MELVVTLPANHPLGVITVESGKRIRVANTQWRNWMLQMITFLTHQVTKVCYFCLNCIYTCIRCAYVYTCSIGWVYLCFADFVWEVVLFTWAFFICIFCSDFCVLENTECLEILVIIKIVLRRQVFCHGRCKYWCIYTWKVHINCPVLQFLLEYAVDDIASFTSLITITYRK